MKIIKEILRLQATNDLHLKSNIFDEISAPMITKGCDSLTRNRLCQRVGGSVTSHKGRTLWIDNLVPV